MPRGLPRTQTLPRACARAAAPERGEPARGQPQRGPEQRQRLFLRAATATRTRLDVLVDLVLVPSDSPGRDLDGLWKPPLCFLRVDVGLGHLDPLHDLPYSQDVALPFLHRYLHAATRRRTRYERSRPDPGSSCSGSLRSLRRHRIRCAIIARAREDLRLAPVTRLGHSVACLADEGEGGAGALNELRCGRPTLRRADPPFREAGLAAMFFLVLGLLVSAGFLRRPDRVSGPGPTPTATD